MPPSSPELTFDGVPFVDGGQYCHVHLTDPLLALPFPPPVSLIQGLHPLLMGHGALDPCSQFPQDLTKLVDKLRLVVLPLPWLVAPPAADDCLRCSETFGYLFFGQRGRRMP